MSDYTAVGEKLLGEVRPASFLCIGPDCADLVPYAVMARDILLVQPELALETLAAERRFDFAFVTGLEVLGPIQGRQLLARLRDVHGGRFAVLMNNNEAGWSDEFYLALGMSRLPIDTLAGNGLRLYGFDLSTYKQTPDWLTPRFWANPERWDKDWW